MKLLIGICIMFTCLGAHAQYGVRLYQHRPLEGSPFIIGNTTSAEIVLSGSIFDSDRIMGRGGITYLNHNILFDTLPTYAVEYSGSQTTVYPGNYLQESFSLFFMSFGADYNIINKDEFKIYAGLDGLAGLFESVQYREIETLRSGRQYYRNLLLGVRGRIGISYLILDWLEPFAEINYGHNWYRGSFNFSTMEPGAGIKFWIDGKY